MAVRFSGLRTFEEVFDNPVLAGLLKLNLAPMFEWIVQPQVTVMNGVQNISPVGNFPQTDFGLCIIAKSKQAVLGQITDVLLVHPDGAVIQGGSKPIPPLRAAGINERARVTKQSSAIRKHFQ